MTLYALSMENTEIPATIQRSDRHGLRGHYAAVTASENLENAYRTGTPITINTPRSPFAGDRVYLGHVQIIPDENPRHIGELSTWTATSGPFQGREIAAYVIDETRLQEAPLFAAELRRINNDSMREYARTEARVAAEAARVEQED